MTINPVFASAVGALTLGEPIGINLVVALLAVFAGIWIATSGPAAKKRDSLAAERSASRSLAGGPCNAHDQRQRRRGGDDEGSHGCSGRPRARSDVSARTRART